MSFFFTKTETKNAPPSLLDGQGCKVCPLNQQPEFPPQGSENPLIYLLTTAPQDIQLVEQDFFSGPEGQILRIALKDVPQDLIRTGSCVWKRPPRRAPTDFEVSCCRDHVTEDIERTKPFAIFGFGQLPLSWALSSGNSNENVMRWRGRRFPVQIGSHVCWFFPMLNPAFLLETKDPKQYDTIFQKDIDRALSFLEREEEPKIETQQEIDEVWETAYSFASGSTEDFHKILLDVCEGEQVGFDIETNNLSPFKENAKILSMGFSSDRGDVVIGWDHPEAQWSKQDKRKLESAIFDSLASAKLVIAQNLGFELKWMVHNFGWKYIDKVHWGDTLAQAFVLDERRGMHNLDVLIRMNFGFHLKEQSNLDIRNLEKEKLEDVLRYNIMDSAYTNKLFGRQEQELIRENVIQVYDGQILRTLSTAGMSVLGMPLNVAEAISLQQDYTLKLIEVEGSIRNSEPAKQYLKKFGKQFDPASPTEVGKLLTQVCGLQLPIKETTGNAITDDDALSELKVPEAKAILHYRQFSKVLSTYLKTIQPEGKDICPDGKVHPTINVNLARTGRLTVEDPPLQQYPKHKDSEVRRVFYAPEGHWLVAFDYGGIEARVLAMVSQDETLVKAFREGYDIHADWAHRIFSTGKSKLGKPEQLKDPVEFKNLRYLAKNRWVFAMFYGSSGYGCARSLMMDADTGEMLEKDFWGMFPGVRNWQQQSRDKYLNDGEIITLTGRVRHGPFEKYNIPLNTQIQSVAGDLLQDAMNRISLQARETEQLWLHPIMQVHDELVFLVPEENLDDIFDIVPHMMLKTPFDFINVPLLVEGEMGRNWCDMESMGDFSSDEFKDEGVNNA